MSLEPCPLKSRNDPFCRSGEIVIPKSANQLKFASRTDRAARRAMDKYQVEFVDLMMAISVADSAANAAHVAHPEPYPIGYAWVEMPSSSNRSFSAMTALLHIGSAMPNGRRFSIQDTNRTVTPEASANTNGAVADAWAGAFVSSLVGYGYTAWAKSRVA